MFSRHRTTRGPWVQPENQLRMSKLHPGIKLVEREDRKARNVDSEDLYTSAIPSRGGDFLNGEASGQGAIVYKTPFQNVGRRHLRCFGGFLSVVPNDGGRAVFQVGKHRSLPDYLLVRSSVHKGRADFIHSILPAEPARAKRGSLSRVAKGRGDSRVRLGVQRRGGTFAAALAPPRCAGCFEGAEISESSSFFMVLVVLSS